MFDTRDCPPPQDCYPSTGRDGPLGDRVTFIIDWTPDFFIETGDLRRVYNRDTESWGLDAEQYVSWATEAIHDTHEQLVGDPYTGTIRSGPKGERLPRQILIEWVQDPDSRACAYATAGAEAGRVVFVLNRIQHANGIEVFCGGWRERKRGTLMHEIAHNYGVHHGGESLMVAAGCERYPARPCNFSAADQYHVQLAYRLLARHQPYVADPQ